MTKKCLIVDDVEVSRYVLKGHMEGFGFTVSETENSDHALEELGRAEYDVVLLDWHLGHESGLNLITKIRQAEKGTRHVPILVCSGVEHGELSADVREHGAECFLEKPVPKERLFEELRKLRLV